MHNLDPDNFRWTKIGAMIGLLLGIIYIIGITTYKKMTADPDNVVDAFANNIPLGLLILAQAMMVTCFSGLIFGVMVAGIRKCVNTIQEERQPLIIEEAPSVIPSQR